jgi:hypothetical protein
VGKKAKTRRIEKESSRFSRWVAAQGGIVTQQDGRTSITLPLPEDADPQELAELMADLEEIGMEVVVHH